MGKESEEIFIPSVLLVVCLSLLSDSLSIPLFLEPKTSQNWFVSPRLLAPGAPASPVCRDSSLCLACFKNQREKAQVCLKRKELSWVWHNFITDIERRKPGMFVAGNVTSGSVRYCLVTPGFSSSITEEVASLGWIIDPWKCESWLCSLPLSCCLFLYAENLELARSLASSFRSAQMVQDPHHLKVMCHWIHGWL